MIHRQHLFSVRAYIRLTERTASPVGPCHMKRLPMPSTTSELPDLTELIKGRLKRRGHGLTKASVHMGRPRNYLSRALRQRDLRISHLIELSALLGENLLVQYVDTLPPSCRTTPAEVALQTELDTLKAELERVKEENAKLWGVIAGRG